MADGLYQHGFDFFFDWPVEVVPGVTANVEIKAYIEPDESVAMTDWYIVSLHIADTDVELPKSEPRTLTISAHCSKTYERQINDKWAEWHLDRPRPRRRA